MIVDAYRVFVDEVSAVEKLLLVTSDEGCVFIDVFCIAVDVPNVVTVLLYPSVVDFVELVLLGITLIDPEKKYAVAFRFTKLIVRISRVVLKPTEFT